MTVTARAPIRAAALEALERPESVEGGLSGLIQRARSAPSKDDGALLCGELNRALEALATGSDPEGKAKALLGLLDDGALHDLEDPQGVACRAVAVEALLTIGYPWALQLEPEDVQFLRAHPVGPRAGFPLAQILSGVAGSGAGLVLAGLPRLNDRWWLIPGGVSLSLGGVLAAMVVSAIPLLLGKPWLKVARWMLGLSSALLAASALMAPDFRTGQILLVVIALFGILGALVPRNPMVIESKPDPSLPPTV